jgi:cytochrome c oxidase cbb3-type subunit 3
MQQNGIPIPEKMELLNKETFWQRQYKQWTKVVPVSKEKDILMGHDYDGIKELDNSLPPWWVAMFYLTILFAGVYMVYYHFAGVGPSSTKKYEVEMEQAKKQKQASLAAQANLVDESNVTLLEEAEALALGATMYQTSCLACHGAKGEGGVGPNLTDDYWIHGGDIKSVFKTIKYGVTEKGMIAWQGQYKPADMQKIASFIKSLKGTNPPNAKEPQGELFQEETSKLATTTDSTVVSSTPTELN